MTTKDLAALAKAVIEANAAFCVTVWTRDEYEDAEARLASACTPETILALTARVEAFEEALRLIAHSGLGEAHYMIGTAHAALNAKEKNNA